MSLADWEKNGWLDLINLDTYRKKRNETEYDFAGNISEDEVIELLDFCKALKVEVLI